MAEIAQTPVTILDHASNLMQEEDDFVAGGFSKGATVKSYVAPIPVTTSSVPELTLMQRLSMDLQKSRESDHVLDVDEIIKMSKIIAGEPKTKQEHIFFNSNPGNNENPYFRDLKLDSEASEVLKFFKDEIAGRPNGQIAEKQTEEGAFMLDFDFYQGRQVGNKVQITDHHITQTVEIVVKQLFTDHNAGNAMCDIYTAVIRRPFEDGKVGVKKENELWKDGMHILVMLFGLTKNYRRYAVEQIASKIQSVYKDCEFVDKTTLKNVNVMECVDSASSYVPVHPITQCKRERSRLGAYPVTHVFKSTVVVGELMLTQQIKFEEFANCYLPLEFSVNPWNGRTKVQIHKFPLTKAVSEAVEAGAKAREEAANASKQSNIIPCLSTLTSERLVQLGDFIGKVLENIPDEMSENTSSWKRIVHSILNTAHQTKNEDFIERCQDLLVKFSARGGSEYPGETAIRDYFDRATSNLYGTLYRTIAYACGETHRTGRILDYGAIKRYNREYYTILPEESIRKSDNKIGTNEVSEDFKTEINWITKDSDEGLANLFARYNAKDIKITDFKQDIVYMWSDSRAIWERKSSVHIKGMFSKFFSGKIDNFINYFEAKQEEEVNETQEVKTQEVKMTEVQRLESELASNTAELDFMLEMAKAAEGKEKKAEHRETCKKIQAENKLLKASIKEAKQKEKEEAKEAKQKEKEEKKRLKEEEKDDIIPLLKSKREYVMSGAREANIFNKLKVKLESTQHETQRDRPWDYDMNKSHPYHFPIIDNKVIDLRNGKVTPRTRDYKFTFSTDRIYDPNMDLSDIERFMMDFTCCNKLDNSDLRYPLYDYLHRKSGYYMSGSMEDRSFDIYHGPQGQNGKSLFFELIKLAMSHNFAQTVANSVVVASNKNLQSANAHSEHLMPLMDLRFSPVSELKADDELNSEFMKQISGSDDISFRGCGGKQQSTKFVCKVVIATNPLPNLTKSANDNAIRDRMRCVPCDARFTDEPDPSKPNEKKKDKVFVDRLMANPNAIFNWMMKGAIKYLSGDKSIPEIVKAKSNDTLDSQNFCKMFATQVCIKSETGRTTGTQLREAYVNWSKDNNFQIINAIEFGKSMKEMLQVSNHSGVTKYHCTLVPEYQKGLDIFAMQQSMPLVFNQVLQQEPAA